MFAPATTYLGFFELIMMLGSSGKFALLINILVCWEKRFS
jgi:hypothetical protein